ncbi:MAG: UDP-N-acetylmuramate dehydrogenase [Lachnospiraceae bacterium]|nr:UDP-N-acetylmuramate dehydrogenase [Lachnospiraceae bacterium]
MYQAFLKEIKSFLDPDQILCREPMKHHTSFRVGGPADYFIRVNTEAQLAKLVPLLQQNGLPYFILGKGSNLLVSDEGYRGVVLLPEGEFRKIEAKEIRILAGAAVSMNKAAETAAEKGLTGLEFASGIPGTIGGGLVMNAGAYGGEMGQVVESARVMDALGRIRLLGKEELQLGYRSSIFKKERLIILQVVLRLKPGNREEILKTMEQYTKARREKQPLEYPSAGSTFKRPEGHYAGKLIMEAGLKGACVGGAQVSPKHCGFVINRDNATAKDIRLLMEKIQAGVWECFQVRLEPEVIFVGEEH